MIDTMLQIASAAACALILLMGMFQSINSMSKDTCHCMRIAWVLITTAAFAVIAGILYGRVVSSPSEVAMYVGVAFYMYFDRRRRPSCSKRAPRRHKLL